MSRPAVMAALAMALVVAAPATAGAATWVVPGFSLGAGAEANVAMGGDGATAYVSLEDAPDPVVQLRRRAPGGALGGPVIVSDPANEASVPRVAASRDGLLAVAWIETTSTGDALVAVARGTLATGLTTSSRLSVAQSADAQDVRVAVASDGAAHVLWATPTTVRRVRYDPVGRLGAPATLQTATAIDEVAVSAAPGGPVAGAWIASTTSGSSETTAVRAARLDLTPVAGTLASATLTEQVGSEGPYETGSALEGFDASVDDAGRLVAGWSRSTASDGGTPNDVDDDTLTYVPQATNALLPAPGAVADLGPPTASGGQVSVASTAGGASAVGFTAGGSGVVARGAPGVVPSSPQVVVPTGTDPVDAIDVAALPAGAPIAAAVRGDEVVAAADGSSPVVVGVEPGTTEPRVAVDGAGNGVAVWSAVAGASAAGFDGEPPRLRRVALPDGGLVGDPLAFAVDAVDVWSAVGARWSFADGDVLTGTTVRKAFQQAGRTPVRLALSDAAGNGDAEREVGTIEVRDRSAGAPAAPPPPVSPAPMGDRTAPTLGVVRIRRARFSPGASSALIDFRLSEPARLVLSVVRLAPVRGLRSRCVLRAPRRGVALRVGSPVRSESARPAGPGFLRFTGRLGPRRVVRGRYELRVLAVDAAGNRSRTAKVRATVC